jgi:cold-inducible RNA-binding protein
MSKKLFVGGLSWGTTDDRLREAFARFGEVTEAKIITDRETGRSRGFGFVTYADPKAGDAAMSALDGQELDGRTIRVNEAQNQQPRRAGGPPRDGGGPPRGGEPRSFGGDDRGRGGGDRDYRDRDRDGGRDDGGRRRERDGGRRQRY